MFRFNDTLTVYLHRLTIDFRTGIKGLAILVEQALGMNPFAAAVYVFSNRWRNRVAAQYDLAAGGAASCRPAYRIRQAFWTAQSRPVRFQHRCHHPAASVCTRSPTNACLTSSSTP